MSCPVYFYIHLRMLIEYHPLLIEQTMRTQLILTVSKIYLNFHRLHLSPTFSCCNIILVHIKQYYIVMDAMVVYSRVNKGRYETGVGLGTV